VTFVEERYLGLVKAAILDATLADVDPGTRDGKVWPPRALTMVGEARLENVWWCVERVLDDAVPGDLIETGVWRGGVVAWMRAVLNSRLAGDRTVWAADSFAGLPRPDAAYPADAGDGHHTIGVLSVPRAVVERNLARLGLLGGVRFLEGWFADTLAVAPIEKLAVLRLDGDLYGSTWEALDALYPKLSPGGFAIVDDYESHPHQCGAAVRDYRARFGISDPIVPVDWTGVYWRKS
jgi:O-methyltransferase